MLNEIVVFVEDGVWNYSTLKGNGPLVAAGAEEGYDSYETVLAAVQAAFPGALIAVPQPDLSVMDSAAGLLTDVPGVSG